MTDALFEPASPKRILLLVQLCRPWPCLRCLPSSCDLAAMASALVPVLLHHDHPFRNRQSGKPYLCPLKKEIMQCLSFLIIWLTCPCVILQFVGLESIMTSITDVYPSQIRKGYRRELLLLLLCTVCYILGLFLVSGVSSTLLIITLSACKRRLWSDQ